MRAAVYARESKAQDVSTDQKSTTRQIEHARAYAQPQGWSVTDAAVFVDDNAVGAEFANRPGYMRLLNALDGSRAPFDVLIVSELPRLGREQLETGYTCKRLAQAGVRIFSYLEDREATRGAHRGHRSTRLDHASTARPTPGRAGSPVGVWKTGKRC